MKAQLPSLLIDLDEGVIDLGWGHPSPRLHPLDAIREAADRLFASGRTESLQYGATQGYGPYLEALSEFLSWQESYGMPVDPRTLFLTAGATQGLDLTCTLFTREGDTVLVEDPTYFVIKGIFRAHHLIIQSIPTDRDGLDVDALEDMLQNRRLRPRFIYTIPSYHNPTGAVLPADRRMVLMLVLWVFGVRDPVFNFAMSVAVGIVADYVFVDTLGMFMPTGWMIEFVQEQLWS